MSSPAQPDAAAKPAFSMRRRVEFADTDMAGIVHFSRFFVFMEDAEHRFWNGLGMSVHTQVDGVRIGWPRVRATCDFQRPARFEDVLDVHLELVRLGKRSLTFRCRFELNGRTVARGELVTACCALHPKEPPSGIDIPQPLVDRLSPFLVPSVDPK